MNEKFIIKDLEDFILTTRTLVYNTFSENVKEPNDIDQLLKKVSKNNQKEFDELISQEEAAQIVDSFIKKQINKKTKRIRYVVDNDSYMKILESLNDRIVSNILNTLVNKGWLESGYDSDSDDFIFWINDEHKERLKKIIENPETD